MRRGEFAGDPVPNWGEVMRGTIEGREENREEEGRRSGGLYSVGRDEDDG